MSVLLEIGCGADPIHVLSLFTSVYDGGEVGGLGSNGLSSLFRG